jgi:hypothetical protein
MLLIALHCTADFLEVRDDLQLLQVRDQRRRAGEGVHSASLQGERGREGVEWLWVEWLGGREGLRECCSVPIVLYCAVICYAMVCSAVL